MPILNFQMKHFLWCSSTFPVVTFLKNSEIIPKPSRFSNRNWRNAMRFHWSEFLKNSWSRCFQLLCIWSTLRKSNQNSWRFLEEFLLQMSSAIVHLIDVGVADYHPWFQPVLASQQKKSIKVGWASLDKFATLFFLSSMPAWLLTLVIATRFLQTEHCAVHCVRKSRAVGRSKTSGGN